MPMKISKPVYALWCGPTCSPPTSCKGVKGLVACLVPDECGNCS